MKKIYIYINSILPPGGIERVISNLSNEWTDKYEVTIIVKDSPAHFYNLDSRVILASIDTPIELNMKSRLSRVLSLAKNLLYSHIKLKKFFKIHSPDIIYTTNPINALEICLLGKKYSDRLIISEHGSKLGYNKIYQLIKKKVYPKAYKISVPTTLDTDLYLQEGLPAVFIPHLSTFKNKEKNKHDNKYILNIGRLTSDKQQITLLKIWGNIVSEKKDNGWKLIIVGKGEEKEHILKYIDDRDLNDYVEIINPIQEIDEIFKCASIFTLTSMFEGFGMVLLEAMSFGIPCISFNCPSGPRDIIDDGVNGYLIEQNDLNDYKLKLLKMMEDEELRNEFSDAAFDKAKEWDNEAILKSWDKLIEGATV